jgi:hypothetical protein
MPAILPSRDLHNPTPGNESTNVGFLNFRAHRSEKRPYFPGLSVALAEGKARTRPISQVIPSVRSSRGEHGWVDSLSSNSFHLREVWLERCNPAF